MAPVLGAKPNFHPRRQFLAKFIFDGLDVGRLFHPLAIVLGSLGWRLCAMLEQRTAAHRWGTPHDLRGALLLLASDAGAYITGHTLVVDGGMTTILA